MKHTSVLKRNLLSHSEICFAAFRAALEKSVVGVENKPGGVIAKLCFLLMNILEASYLREREREGEGEREREREREISS